MSIYQSTPGGFTTEELAKSEAPAIYASMAVTFVIATLAVILRYVARVRSKAHISWDDYTILLALVFLYGLNILTILDCARYGLGRHLPAVNRELIPSFQKTGLANFIMYFTTCATIKASLLLLYYRYFGISKHFRWALYFCSALISCWYLAVFFATIFQCIPAQAFWDHSYRNPKCMSPVRFSVGSGITNLLTDVIILCLPMPMVWTLHTNRAQKWTLTGIFLLGFFVCAISIIRITQLAKLNTLDVTWDLRDVFIWTSFEPSIGILSACLPTMRPLFGRFSRISSRIAPITKPAPASKKSVSTESTLRTVSPRQEWGFSRLDEEAATLSPEPKKPAIVSTPWDGITGGDEAQHWEHTNSRKGSRTGRDAYEMRGFEEKTSNHQTR